MGGKSTSSTGKSQSTGGKGGLKSSKLSPSASRPMGRYAEAKWHTVDYKPQRKITDEELTAAKKMFFQLDTDSSGSIEAEELGVMLRSMGQNPTEEQLKELIVKAPPPESEAAGLRA